MFDFEKFWQSNLNEIKENKIRFALVCVCFIAAVFLFLNEDDGGEEIILSENPAPVETVDADKRIVTIKNAANPTNNENIKVVLGANSDDLYVHDPFKVPQKEKIPPPPEIPTPTVTTPVAQVTIPTAEKFLLRGTAIIGDNKSALVQKITGESNNSAEENLIVGIGDNLNGKMIIDITQDFLILDDGTRIYIDTQTP